MGALKGVVVRCDWRDCEEMYWLTSTPPPTVAYGRMRALEAGWERTEVFDLCPKHHGKRPIQR
jgi:hypothetical protein